MPRKTLRFPTLIGAEIVVSALESAGIKASIDNENISSIAPMMTDALGGVAVSYDENDEAAVKEILDSINGAPRTDVEEDKIPNKEFYSALKSGLYGAVFGAFILPGISAVFSSVQLIKACRHNPGLFKKNIGTISIAIIFNLIGILMIVLYLRLRNDSH